LDEDQKEEKVQQRQISQDNEQNFEMAQIVWDFIIFQCKTTDN
jgi:hypothetical protein